MSTLIMIGNTNQYTFANSIIVANEKSKELFDGKELENIHVFHTPESFNCLLTNKSQKDELAWDEVLFQKGIENNKFTHRILEINSDKNSEEVLNRFGKTLEEILDKNETVILDLSNGPIFQRNILSVISYILNIETQYMIDISKLSRLTQERGYLPIELLEKSYVRAPETHQLDSLAYLDLSEIKRYKFEINKLSQKFKSVSINSDIDFFKENLVRSIELKLRGDKIDDNTLYRIASASVASSAEELISLILEKKGSTGHDEKTLGQKLNLLFNVIKDEDTDIDLTFLKELNSFILFLRNTTTHKSSKKRLSNLEKFKAELSMTMSLEFIEYYIDIVYPSLKEKSLISPKEGISYISEPSNNKTYYFGIDGDNTGISLESLFMDGIEEDLRNTSNRITNAFNKMKKYIKDENKDNKIIFQAGDDMLIKGKLNFKNLEELKNIYKEETKGLTCSIGYGLSLRDTYMALKLAKANAQKNMIKGIYLN